MNIIEAAMYLEEGNKIRIESWKKDQYIFMVDRKILAMPPVCHDAEFYAISTDDMLSTNWEIYEEQSPMDKAWEDWKIKYPNTVGAFIEQHELFKYTWNAAEKHFKNGSDIKDFMDLIKSELMADIEASLERIRVKHNIPTVSQNTLVSYLIGMK
jgi:hypothetical protein